MWIKTQSGELCNLAHLSDVRICDGEDGDFVVVGFLPELEEETQARLYYTISKHTTKEEAQAALNEIWNALRESGRTCPLDMREWTRTAARTRTHAAVPEAAAGV